MLVVVSPAKKLDWSPVDLNLTEPEFQADAAYLADVAAQLSTGDLRKLMGISEALAALNQTRFRDFEKAPDIKATRPAAWAFAGDTYQGLEAKTLDGDARDWAQSHLRILSGLYALLRPLDRIQPYRLEMGSRLRTTSATSLYGYWGARIAVALNRQAAATDSDILVNCASNEYFQAVDRATLRPRVVTPVFLEERGGEAKVISFYAKRARGAMARFIVERRVSGIEGLKEFDAGGYSFDSAQSDAERLVFLRSEMAREAAAA